MTAKSEPSGVLVLDKPAGMTSHDAVSAIRRLFRTKRVGHTGTLDPDATGVLVLCIGHATRVAEYLSASRKCYRAVIRFGVTTDTEDASGAVISREPAAHLTAEDVAAVLPQFRGAILQTPPMYSAVHHEGKRLYELARKGIEVERQARPVQIYSLEMAWFQPGEEATAQLDLVCSTGTYVRTLCADIGAALGVGAIMQSLRRLWVGESQGWAFTLDDARSFREIEDEPDACARERVLLPVRSALFGWPVAMLDEAGVARIRMGQAVPLPEAIAVTPDSGRGDGANIAIANSAGDVFAIGVVRSDRLQPRKVFV